MQNYYLCSMSFSIEDGVHEMQPFKMFTLKGVSDQRAWNYLEWLQSHEFINQNLKNADLKNVISVSSLE